VTFDASLLPNAFRSHSRLLCFAYILTFQMQSTNQRCRWCLIFHKAYDLPWSGHNKQNSESYATGYFRTEPRPSWVPTPSRTNLLSCTHLLVCRINNNQHSISFVRRLVTPALSASASLSIFHVSTMKRIAGATLFLIQCRRSIPAR